MRYSLPLPSCCLLPAITACSGLPGTAQGGRAPRFTPTSTKRASASPSRLPSTSLPSRLQEDDSRLSRNSKSLLERREALQDEQLTETLAARNYCRTGWHSPQPDLLEDPGSATRPPPRADRDAFPTRPPGRSNVHR